MQKLIAGEELQINDAVEIKEDGKVYKIKRPFLGTIKIGDEGEEYSYEEMIDNGDGTFDLQGLEPIKRLPVVESSGMRVMIEGQDFELVENKDGVLVSKRGDFYNRYNIVAKINGEEFPIYKA